VPRATHKSTRDTPAARGRVVGVGVSVRGRELHAAAIERRGHLGSAKDQVHGGDGPQSVLGVGPDELAPFGETSEAIVSCSELGPQLGALAW
jgi:hypothetical protein